MKRIISLVLMVMVLLLPMSVYATDLDLDLDIKVDASILLGTWESVATVDAIDEFNYEESSHERMIVKYGDRAALKTVEFKVDNVASFITFTGFKPDYYWKENIINLWGLHDCKMTVQVINDNYYLFMENKDGTFKDTGKYGYYVFKKISDAEATDTSVKPIDTPKTKRLSDSYELSGKIVEFKDVSDASAWARHTIQELHDSGMLAETAFTSYKEGITRQDFVYLMVKLYENLKDQAITIDPEISFTDSNDHYVLKAASIGITSGIGNQQFGPDRVINREQMATFIVKTLELSGISLMISDEVQAFSDDEAISSWAKNATYLAKNNDILNGVGNNMYSPKKEATHEQALMITHKLMTQYGNLTWGQSLDKDRVYIKINEALYQLPLNEDMILVDESVYFKTYKDINNFIASVNLDTSNINYTELSNPNVKGVLTFEEDVVDIKLENIYYGVDMTGEKLSINILDGTYTGMVNNLFENNQYSYSGYVPVKYYDQDKNPFYIYTLPTDKVCALLKRTYEVTYNSLWDIYVIEFSSVEE